MVTTDQNALNNLKQSILSTVEIHCIEAAERQFLDKSLSKELQVVRHLFASLEQTSTGQWRFRPQ